MVLKDQINADLKQALLSGDKELASVLRGIKSVILNEEVAQKKRDSGLDDEVIIALLQKETKKRNEAAQLYEKAGDKARTEQELYEVKIISGYLPEMMNEQEVTELVDAVIIEKDAKDMSAMGQVIGEVRKRSAGKADGALIAKVAKERLG